MIFLLLFIVLGSGIAYGLYRFFPEATKRWFYRIQAARSLVFTLGFVMTTLVLLISGVPTLQFVGLVFVVLGALEVIFESPTDALTGRF